MSGRSASSTGQLLRASFDDQACLDLAIPDSGFGFHAQQAVEKLYKALLAHLTGDYPFVHDLHSLRLRVESVGVQLPPCSFRLEELTEYAGDARYADPVEVNEETRAVLRACIAALREFVLVQVGEGMGS